MRYSMIMAGGAGTRLWPLSRKQRPKQLLPMIERTAQGERPMSLIGLSDARLEGLIAAEHRYVCTAEQYRSQVLEAIPTLTDDRLLGEPAARDTVNAIGLTAAVLAKRDPDAVFCVLTADHIITPEDRFRDRLELGFQLVERDPSRLVTFSIKPTYPATGFGYVERGGAIHGEGTSVGSEPIAFEVARFVEKPDVHRAQAYVESGQFGWNSGMFVFHAQSLMQTLKNYQPESHAGLSKIAAAWDTDEQQKVLEEVYPSLPKISVDYAIMEPASTDANTPVSTVIMDIDWLDVGSWPSYAETIEADADGNRTAGAGASVLEECSNTLVYSGVEGRTVSVLGVEGLVIVETADATLVMSAAEAEKLKQLHARLDDSLK